jgi:hypothetical protein
LKHKSKTQITLVGGGSSAHALIPFLDHPDREIRILTRNPKEWQSNIVIEWQDSFEKINATYSGKLSEASSDPAKIIPEAVIIILCMPVFQYRVALHHIAKYIHPKKNVLIGTVYGQGGFNWMVEEIKKKFNLHHLSTFTIGLIPWVCRVKTYGKTGITYGPKAVNVVAFDDQNKFFSTADIFHDMCFKWFKTGMFKLAENFISLTLSVDNQIIHPSRLYAMYQKSKGIWDNLDDVPLFYRDYDDFSAQTLKDLDDDYSLIRQHIIGHYPNQTFTYMLDYLSLERLSYQSINESIKESFTSSKTLATIKTPVVFNNNHWEIDKNHRFFHDDVYYGLCIAKWIASTMNINVKTIDNMLRWSQEMLNDKILDDNNQLIERNPQSGSPSSYGYQTLNDIIK